MKTSNPRHHRTQLEGRYPPVSGECPSPIQNKPASCSSLQTAVHGEAKPNVRGSESQARRHSRLTQAHRSRGSLAHRHSWPTQARRPRGSQARRHSWLIQAYRQRLRSHAHHRQRLSQACHPRLLQARRPPHRCLWEYSSFMMWCLGAHNAPQSSLLSWLQAQSLLLCRLQPQGFQYLNIHRYSDRSSGTHDAPGIWISKHKIYIFEW